METTSLHAIDIGIILTYMAGVLILGVIFSRYVKTGGDFFVAGRALPFWAIGMSVVVSDIGAMDFIAVAGETYNSGIAVANFDWIGSMPAMVFAAFIFIPYYWRAGVYTIPEFLGKRYNRGVQVLHAAIWGVFLFVTTSVGLWITADKFLNQVLNWDANLNQMFGTEGWYYGVWVMVLIVGIYTFSGGLTAVVMTDTIQMILMFVGGFALLALSLHAVGGFSGLVDGVYARGPEFENHFKILLPHDTKTAFPWTGIVFGLGIVMATAYMSGNQAVVQRTLGARSEWDAKGGMLFAGFLKSFIPLLVAVPGLCAVILLPDLEVGDDAVPTLMKTLLPPGLRGLMFAALFAALMSSMDSALNSASTIWTTDLYGQGYRLVAGREMSERQSLFVGRSFTFIFVILAGALAKQFGENDGIYNFLQTALSMFQGPVFAILLLGIMWRRTTQWGGLFGLILGVMFTTILHNIDGLFASSDPFLFVSWWSFVFTMVVTILISILTPPEPEEKIRGLVFGQVMKDGELQRVLRDRSE